MGRAWVLAAGVLAALLVTVAATAPEVAHAQARTAPTDAQRQRARELYAEGQRQFQADHFAEALTAFEGAYAQVPNPVVLLGVASAQERLGRTADAARTLRRYLRERTDAPDRATIEARIAQLDPTGATAEAPPVAATPATGTVRVSCTPEGALIAVDGVQTGRTAPAELTLPAGDHEVALTLEGYQPIAQTVTVAAGGTHELTLTLAAEDEPAAASSEEEIFGGGEAGAGETAPPAELPAPVDPGPSAGVWVTTAIAGVGLVTGTVFGFLALSRQSDFDSNPTNAIADEGETFALVADLSFGVAIAAGITAIVLYATERPSAPAVAETTTTTETETETEPEGGEAVPPAEEAPAPTSSRQAGPRFTLAPFGSPTGGGAAMSVTF